MVSPSCWSSRTWCSRWPSPIAATCWRTARLHWPGEQTSLRTIRASSAPILVPSGRSLLRLPSGEDVGAGRRPNAAMALDAIQRLLDCGDAMRHAADPGPEGQRDDAPATVGRLAVEEVKMIHHLLDEIGWLVFVEMEDLQVADLIGVRHGMDGPGLGLKPVGHIVIDPVAHILAILCGNQIERVVAFRIGWRVPAFDRLARQLSQR